jgi:hypothetical protein
MNCNAAALYWKMRQFGSLSCIGSSTRVIGMKTFSIRSELWLAFIVILLSVLLLPALIYLVGAPLFGVYKAGLAGMYAAQLQGLVQPQVAPWIVALAPACGLWLLRTVLRLTASSPPEAPTKPMRREPRVGS